MYKAYLSTNLNKQNLYLYFFRLSVYDLFVKCRLYNLIKSIVGNN